MRAGMVLKGGQDLASSPSIQRPVLGAIVLAVAAAGLTGYLRSPEGPFPIAHERPALPPRIASAPAVEAVPVQAPGPVASNDAQATVAPPAALQEVHPSVAERVAPEAPDAGPVQGMARSESLAEGGPAAVPAPQVAVSEPSPVVPAPASRLVPLPVARPPELREIRAAPRMRLPSRSVAATAAPAPQAQADDRNFIEKLFGVDAPKSPVTAYAALESGAADDIFRRRVAALPVPAPAPSVPVTASPSPGVAVYDIRAKVVILPSGERLEAHSGLGDGMDNPNRVHVKMRGATPPGTYDLTEREALFHGVRALRMTPVGGPDAIHGRVGILAHTYMLGPSGASNGCVSFKDYDKFLQAYLRGEVQRLVVVPGKA